MSGKTKLRELSASFRRQSERYAGRADRVTSAGEQAYALGKSDAYAIAASRLLELTEGGP